MRFGSKIFVIAACALALPLTAGCGSSQGVVGQSSHNLKLPVFRPQTSAQPQALKWIIDQIFKRTKGKVKITPYLALHWLGRSTPVPFVIADRLVVVLLFKLPILVGWLPNLAHVK